MKNKKKILLVLLVAIVLALSYYVYLSVKFQSPFRGAYAFTCPPWKTYVEMRDNFSGICYKPTGKEGNVCKSSSECGTGVCLTNRIGIGLSPEGAPSTGICEDIRIGCREELSDDGSIQNWCWD